MNDTTPKQLVQRSISLSSEFSVELEDAQQDIELIEGLAIAAYKAMASAKCKTIHYFATELWAELFSLEQDLDNYTS